MMFRTAIADDHFPRWGWFWQLLALLGLMCCATGIAWYWSAWESYWRLSAAVAEIRATGDQVTYTDRVRAGETNPKIVGPKFAAISAEANRANLLPVFLAIEASAGSRSIDVGHNTRYLVDSTRKLRQKAKDAVAHGELFWASANGAPPVHAEPILAAHCIAIQLAGARDDLRTALDEFRTGMQHVESVGRGASTIWAHLVAQRWRSRLQTALVTSCGPLIQDAEYPIVRDELLALIEKFSDGQPARDAYRAALRGERAEFFEPARMMFALPERLLDPPGMLPSITAVRVRMAALAYLARFAEAEALVNARDFEAASRDTSSDPVRNGLADRYAHVLSDIISPKMNTRWLFAPMIGDFCTAVALATALYRREQGQSPVTVRDLVPEYLDRALVDPFHPEGASIQLVETCDGIEFQGFRVPDSDSRKTEIFRVLLELPNKRSTECVIDDEQEKDESRDADVDE